MSVHTVRCNAPAERVWELIARPGEWHRWSPHVRGAEGLGTPEVEQGARGRVLLRGGLSLEATITEVSERSWTWRVAGLEVSHTVHPHDDGCELEMAVGARPLARPAAIIYGPLVGLVARNIARVAAAAET